jgi:hypothetical protein
LQGGPYTTVTAGLTAPEYHDRGLANGTTYYHVVTAVNASGESGHTNETRTMARANLALWQRSFASSMANTDRQPFKAFDGALETFEGLTSRWESQFSDPQWIYVDLQTVYPVDHVQLTWDSAYAKAYSIDVSTDAVRWRSVYTTTTANGGGDDIRFTAANARYVRMKGTRRGTVYGYSLKEFEVYGAVPPPASSASRVWPLFEPK